MSYTCRLVNDRDTYDGAAGGGRAVPATRLASLICAIGSETAGLGMQSHLVELHEIDTLDDIDFTIGRPVVALGPDTRPDLHRAQFKQWRGLTANSRTEQPKGR